MKISETNDNIRKAIPAVPLPHRFLLSTQVRELDPETLQKVLAAVRTFDSFNDDNDPSAEHDFGKFSLDGEKYFWKVDYYDSDLKSYQEDGTRVLMIMKADEY